MEISFETLQAFISSPSCLFEFNSLDYPTPFQQKCINAYFEMKELLEKEHNQIVRMMNASNDRNLESIMLGVLYVILVKPQECTTLFEQYMGILRVEGWLFFIKNISQLIKESFLVVRYKFRQNIPLIIEKIYGFNQLTEELLILSIKSMDSIDLSQDSLNYCNAFVDLFQKIIRKDLNHYQFHTQLTSNALHTQLTSNPLHNQVSSNPLHSQVSPYTNTAYRISNNPKIIHVLCSHLFYKTMRAMTLINLIQEDSVKDYKRKCIEIVISLFQYDMKLCIYAGSEFLRIIRQLQNQRALQKIIEASKIYLLSGQLTQRSSQKDRNISFQNNCPPQFYPLKEIVGLVLPFRIQTCIMYILQQSLSKTEVNIQFSWIFNDLPQHYQLILVDMLKYILYLPKQQFKIDQMLYIMQWLLYRCCSNNILLQIWKGQLFSACFAEQNCIYNGQGHEVQISLRFLAYMLVINLQFGENLLVYYLRISHDVNYKKRMRQIIIKANQMNILKIREIFENIHINVRTKHQLRIFLEEQRISHQPQQTNQQPNRASLSANNSSSQIEINKPGREEQLYYDPLQMYNPIQNLDSNQENPSQRVMRADRKDSFDGMQNLKFHDDEGSYNEEESAMENHYLEDQRYYESNVVIASEEINQKVSKNFSQSSKQMKLTHQKMSQSKAQYSLEQVDALEYPEMIQPDIKEQYLIKLEKQFCQDMGEALITLLNQPNLDNLKLFMKVAFDQIKSHKKNNENAVIDIFISEIAKVQYLMFNYEFQDHQARRNIGNQSIICYLLGLIQNDWKSNTFNVQIMKRIIKKIIELFPTSEPAFWFYFFFLFKRGSGSNLKEIKDWLFGKDKQEIVIPILKGLCKAHLPKEIIDNAILFQFVI